MIFVPPLGDVYGGDVYGTKKVRSKYAGRNNPFCLTTKVRKSFIFDSQR